MNSGNLAEDPRAGLSSSSRYSRNGGEKNSLLYVDSSSLRKERKAAERRAGSQASAIKGENNSKNKKSVGRGLANSHMDRLEVGSDGRLFQIKESQTPSVSSVPKQDAASAASAAVSVPASPAASAADSMPANPTASAADSMPTNPAASIPVNTENPENKNNTGFSAAQDIRPAIAGDVLSDAVKPERLYLTKDNPLLAKPKSTPRPREKEPVSAAAPVRHFIYRIRVPLIASVAVLVVAGYSYVGWHYRNRFYPGTEFFGIPAAEQSVYDVKAAVKEKVDSYCLQLVARDPRTDDSTEGVSFAKGTASGGASAASYASHTSGSGAHASKEDVPASAKENIITAEDVGMIYRDNGEIDNAMKAQKSWAWPVMMLARMFGEGDSALETSYDSSLVPEAVSRLACMQKENMIKPQDAQIVLTDNGAQVQTEIYGTTLNVEKTEEEVRNALDRGLTMIDLDDLGLYKGPKVNSGDISLTADAMAMNKVLGAKVLLRIGNRTEVINSEVIATFLDKKGNQYFLNEEKVREYVSELAEKYDTLQCERDFYTSIGTKITLEAGYGDYGWQMDQEATCEKILDAIRAQKKLTIEPVYTQEAYCRDANDIGDTYVEISLTNQMMWFYKDGKLIVETPVVTGNPYTGHETPSGGVWYLKGKMRNQTLVGQGYASPVDYWMPFNNGVGIHDMQSRAWFGGSIYLGSGSHGCVNTPLSAVKLIYDQIEEGVPIVVYKDESDEAMEQITGPTDIQTLNAQIEETYGTVEDDGIGSIVSWSRAQQAQAQAAAAAAQAATSGVSVS